MVHIWHWNRKNLNLIRLMYYILRNGIDTSHTVIFCGRNVTTEPDEICQINLMKYWKCAWIFALA